MSKTSFLLSVENFSKPTPSSSGVRFEKILYYLHRRRSTNKRTLCRQSGGSGLLPFINRPFGFVSWTRLVLRKSFVKTISTDSDGRQLFIRSRPTVFHVSLGFHTKTNRPYIWFSKFAVRRRIEKSSFAVHLVFDRISFRRVSAKTKNEVSIRDTIRRPLR